MRWKALEDLSKKGLLIFAIWMILHTHTHPCTPADNKTPKKGRLGPLKGLTSLENELFFKLQLEIQWGATCITTSSPRPLNPWVAMVGC